MLLYSPRIILLFEVSAIILSCILAASNDNCNRHETCKKCIRQPQCSWCSQKNFTNEKRCFNSAADGVDCEQVTNPGVSVSTREGTLGDSYDGRPDSELAEGEVPHRIQITPLEVNLTLRPNKELSVGVKFKLSKDYPLDVYYLTDSSWSMRRDIIQVAQHGANISRVMRNITKNFRLGCGMFADKPVRPFSYFYSGCEQQEGVCRSLKEENGRKYFVDQFEFQNLLSLKADSAQFREKLEGIQVQGNQDDPEGGLSALMQVIVCKEKVGWRDNSNRLLIYSSDSEYHQAGDGKLGGIVIPNDGKCHLDQEGFYTHSTIMDYPSVSHINYMASKHNTMIIFAITKPEAYIFYEQLSQGIKGSSFAKLVNGSNSVVELIENEYKKIISYVELNDTSSELIDVKYRASCSEGAPMVESQRCSNLKIGSEVNFEVTFKLKDCPADGNSRSETFELRPSGMNESVIVNVEMICECQCEKEDVQKKAAECNKAGSYQCGVCACDSDYSGWNCECDKADTHDDKARNKCRPSGNHTLECSGNGVCECDRCRCIYEHISGTYCECDDSSCRKKDNKVCNGHGKCNCGQCECDLGWRHASPHDPVCDCIESQDACLSHATPHLVCSGKGRCQCGECVCNEGYDGDHCQVILLRPSVCGEIEACVECLAYGTGPKFDLLKQTNCTDDCSLKLSFDFDRYESDEKSLKCSSKDANGCSYQFVCHYEDMQLIISAQKEKPECKKINVMMLVITTTAIGLLAGVLALIAWKLVTMTFDRLEYMKFMKEQERASWDQAGNPLYKAPTTTIQNPMFQTDS